MADDENAQGTQPTRAEEGAEGRSEMPEHAPAVDIIGGSSASDIDASTMFALDISSMMNHTEMASMLALQHEM